MSLTIPWIEIEPYSRYDQLDSVKLYAICPLLKYHFTYSGFYQMVFKYEYTSIHSVAVARGRWAQNAINHAQFTISQAQIAIFGRIAFHFN